jgi:hypothetical protein
MEFYLKLRALHIFGALYGRSGRTCLRTPCSMRYVRTGTVCNDDFVHNPALATLLHPCTYIRLIYVQFGMKYFFSRTTEVYVLLRLHARVQGVILFL